PALVDDCCSERDAQSASGPSSANADRSFKRSSDDEQGGEAIGQKENHADGMVDSGCDDHQGLRHRHKGEQYCLVGSRLHHIGGEACRVVGRIDDEHNDKDAEGQQRASLFGQPEAPVPHAFAPCPCGACTPMLSALEISACSVISPPTSSLRTAAS